MVKNRDALKDYSLVGQVAKEIKSDIFKGSIKGGERLLENDIKDRFGISRAPVREAFRVLENAGLIEILPRRGVFVKRITIDDIKENFPIRAMLEGLAARLSCENITSDDIREMEKTYNLMKKAAENKDFEQFADHHFYAHEIFINASRNKTLINLLESLRMHALWHRYTYQYYKEVHQESLQYHRKILNLYKAKNLSAIKIETLVREHIEVAMETFVDAMKKLEGNE